MHRVEPRPLDSARQPRPRPGVHVLAVVQRRDREVAGPRQPPLRPYHRPNVRLHEHGPRVLLPWPAQVRRRGVGPRPDEVSGGGDVAEVEGEAGVLVGVLPALSCDRVLLLRQRPPG